MTFVTSYKSLVKSLSSLDVSKGFMRAVSTVVSATKSVKSPRFVYEKCADLKNLKLPLLNLSLNFSQIIIFCPHWQTKLCSYFFKEGLCAWHIIFASFYVRHSLIELIVTNHVVLPNIFYILFLRLTSKHVTHVIGKLQFCRGAL